jgi:RNA polymerase sigma factor (sigma-70 family)
VRLRPHGRLGPYELESAIGEGGLGEVWKARNASAGRLVALRILPTPPPGDPFRFARFDDDVRKLIALIHPNIAKVYELIHIEGVRALACEWVVGESLAHRLAAGPLAVNDAVRIMAQVANGLAAAHSRDLVHGDVKPSNIALCADGTVKVLDVGLVEIYDSGGVTPQSDVRPAISARLLGAITGTAAYMSPEQISGGAADSRADVWAFGCVVYEMLTGKPAFSADDLTDTMARVAGAEPEWTLVPATAPVPLVQMLRRCLEKDAARRFHRMTEVLSPIRQAIGEEGALEAFLRQSALRRMSHTTIEPGWVDETWLEIQKLLPWLRRWAHGRLPRGSAEDTSDVVQEAVLDALKNLQDVPPGQQRALQAYLRQSVSNRIRASVRRQPFTSVSDVDREDDGVDSEMMVRYREVLKQLNERDRALIESRLEEHETYDQIATRFSFPTLAAARIAVTRALRRLADSLIRKRD